MKSASYIKPLGYLFGLAIMSLSMPVLANKDVLYPASAAATINGASVTGSDISSSFSSGANGNTTINKDIYLGEFVEVAASWSIKDNSAGPGQDTSYSTGTITFAFATNVKPAGAEDVTLAADIPNCTLQSNAGSCPTTLGFYPPSTPGSYSVTVTSGGVAYNGPTGLTDAKTYTLNFTVAESVVSEDPIDTTLTVSEQCLLLNAGDVDLSATLTELDNSGNAIDGATVDFYIDPELENGVPTAPSIGSAITQNGGVATLTHNINGLGVGDYTLYGEFDGDPNYAPSNDSATLGISYLFVGFQQPINPEGNSIFGGRVIPIKIKLVDALGNPVEDAAPTVWLTSYSTATGLGEVLETVSSVSAADTDNVMRYDASEQKYIYNWDARDLANGTYAVVVDLGDSATCRTQNPYAIITVAKKGKK